MTQQNWTEEQLEIIGRAAQRHGSAMVQAGAGCAKTTTGKAAMQRIRSPGLALAFNKVTAMDLGKAMPGSFDSRSFNALGHRAWARALPGIPIKLDDRKVGKLVSSAARDFRLELTSEQWAGARQMVTLAQAQGLVPLGDEMAENTLVEDSPETWKDLGFQAGLVREDTELVWELARGVLVEDIRLARAGVISFDDQVYCSSMLGGRFPKYPVVFVDEAQDLSSLNIRMVGQCLGKSARLFVVGDANQAIYAWRGASGTSMEDIRGLMPEEEWQNFPLMTTFRCPKEIVARQQEHVPGFRAWHANPEGRVVSLRGEDGWIWNQVIEELPYPGCKITVLCRNNAPLLKLGLKLLRQGVGIHIAGRDIGKSLIGLSRKILPEDLTPREICAGMLGDWMNGELALARANNQESRMETISDQGEALLAVLEGAECRDARGLRMVMEQLFARENGQVLLSSIHRAKGLEWDFVLHLDPWRIPGKWAKKAAKEGNPVPLRQERNLRYVAETRTKHTLMLADLEGFHG